MMALAMARYPGGTWDQPRARGHSLSENFLCDLMRPIALNGEPNVDGAAFAELGLLAFCVALAPFFLVLPALFAERRRLGMAVAICGLLSSVGGVGIVLAPSHRVGSLFHGLVVLLAAVPGLTAAITGTVGAWSAGARAIRAAAASTLSVTALSVAVFAVQLLRGTETTPGLPLLEKAAIASAMAWMLLTMFSVVRAKA